MEDQSMLGMFESDTTSFLEELAGPTSSMASMMPQQGGMDPSMASMHMQQQQPQPQWGQPAQQKLHHYADYGQQRPMAPQQQQNMMSPHQQFGSPPPQMSPGYNFQAAQSPRMTSPRQTPPWPQQQPAISQSSSMPQYGSMKTTYHDYNMPPSSGQQGPRMMHGHYQQPHGNNYPNNPMGSPPPNMGMGVNHGGHMQYGMQGGMPMHQPNSMGGYGQPMHHDQMNGNRMYGAYNQAQNRMMRPPMPDQMGHYPQQPQTSMQYRGYNSAPSPQGNYAPQQSHIMQRPPSSSSWMPPTSSGPGMGQPPMDKSQAKVQLSSVQTNPQQLAAEIHGLQQQVNQLYNMPQTPQTQQKMLEAQERLRTLKAQQLMMQQQGYPPEQQQAQAAAIQAGPGTGINVQQIQMQPGQMQQTIIIQQQPQAQSNLILQQHQQPASSEVSFLFYLFLPECNIFMCLGGLFCPRLF
jgi:hypothetical protein